MLSLFIIFKVAVNIGSTMRLNKKIRQSNKRPINKPMP
jgi:hypothetical protein